GGASHDSRCAPPAGVQSLIFRNSITNLAVIVKIFDFFFGNFRRFHGYIGPKFIWLIGAIVAGGLSLLGVPLTAGFISKWYLVQAALQSNLWWLVILIALSSMLALVYVWRLVEALYFKEPSPNNAAVTEAPLSMLLPTLLLAGANIYFGIDTRVPVAMAEHAAELLMRGQIW
ncbi:MAG: hypothetical protein HN596_03890, partial [Rhodospirillaceae bacterium]|nr:hypothetical protein [Rhodospirillaceae bacterium]